MKINNIYSAIACNRTTESADWGNNGLILFSGCNSVNIFDPNYHGSAKITKTYVKHTKRVNTVKWIKANPAIADLNEIETEFISGSDDGTAIIWRKTHEDITTFLKLEGHESGINAVDTIYTGAGELIVATGSADSSIKLWSISPDQKIQNFQTILLLRNGFCFAIRMEILPGTTNQILLAYAGDDNTISLWTKSPEDKQFHKIHQLVGHENWVRGLDFVTTKENDLLLASSSQDTLIRLWKISPRSADEVKQNEIDLIRLPEGDLHVEETILNVKTANEAVWFAFSLESVLQGHEGWVYGVNWHKNAQTGEILLLSSSIDKTMIVWKFYSDDGVWMEKARVGEVGGNSLGFYGGKFAPTGLAMLGHGFQGSFHIWEETENNFWSPKTIIGGHFNEVKDLGWEPNGEFLFTVSTDQTTRIHAPWIRDDDVTTWHELVRPQVHGYDMQSIAVLSRYKFASGAEEKIVRIFQAPGNFIENFRRICKIADDQEGDVLMQNLPKGASVPSLGLSNKAVYDIEKENPLEEKHVKNEYPENYFVPVELKSPPHEETLMQNTLWPEIQKLYGHGYEIFALAASADGKLLASSCKAATAEHAQIILWNTKTWKQIQKLPSHQLTVTQMKFSPNNKYLVSVSRDRKFTIFENQSNSEDTITNFVLCARPDKSNGIHSRIIWSCDWSHDSKLFGTSSRDGKAVLWTKNNKNVGSSLKDWNSLGILVLAGESITAIAFAPTFINENDYLIALGFETGKINLYKFNSEWTLLFSMDSSHAHHLTVTKLQFRPNKYEIYLSSCGDDHFVRIYQIIPISN